MVMTILQQILTKRNEGQKQFAVLADPDKLTNAGTERLCHLTENAGVDYIFVGGSLLTNGNFFNCISRIREACHIPVVLFPGNGHQIDGNADAMLFLSLISGRNPDLLIGKHVVSAPLIREKKLETIPTGYMLIESGTTTTALYMSNTLPIPADKPDIAASTAMAGEMLGMQLIFMDAGSGAKNPVSEQMITEVRQAIDVPLVVGGGIRTPEKAAANFKSGADMIVVGNSLETNPDLIKEIARAARESSAVTH
jgi:phosphoglycerol geranylgeranyltransferase